MNLEQAIVRFSAPVLAGIKPASLFSVSIKDYPDLNGDINTLNASLAKKGVSFQPVRRYNDRSLIFIYRRSMLESYLFQLDISHYLEQRGYSVHQGFDVIITELFDRLVERLSFPHEVGIFLGYPLDDVVDFVKYQGQNCRICGYWKVYGDTGEAQRRFSEYDQCTKKLVNLYKQGVSFIQLCAVA